MTIRTKLLQASAWAFSCGYSALTVHTEDEDIYSGTRDFPYEINFVPTDAVKDLFSSEKEIDADGKQVSWLDQMKRIPEGTEIFKVIAQNGPPGGDPKWKKKVDSSWVDIATITLQTSMHTSKFGDERLFFQHILREDDMPYQPKNWKNLDEHVDPSVRIKKGGRWNVELPA